ncbi:MAG: YggS family pyridoxal phosphate-dependent enzyme [Deltaproteobacteria bacterium]|nr:YggS family pyridoxal phosphate-dependent enzyme [Deltaproteobacteria bacterium]MBV8451809.1 YggS family pyridoxal phosphate-dependent enzyme [Deltaproteobacteria bacterium]
MLTAREIGDRLEQVQGRIADAVRRAGRESESVRLVLASKTQPPAAVAAAFAAGARDFGENYVQEAAAKRSALGGHDIRWHLIGHLQTNKARTAVETFNLIQTLDNQRLASALSRLRPSPLIPVLVEINLAGETSKTGIKPEDAEALINSVRAQVDVQGLMAIPPMASTPEAARPFFRALRELRDRLTAATGLALSELSMGMTDDFVAAILEGATIVRVGRAVFGER